MTSKAAKSVLRVVNCSIHNVPPQNGRIVTNFFEQKVRLLSTSFKSCPFSEHNDQIDSRVSTVSTPVSTSPGMSKSSARMSMRSTSSRLRTRSTSPSFSHLSSSSLELKPPIQSTTNTMNINTDVTMAATTARCPLGFDRSIEKAFNSENSPIHSDQFRLARTRHLGTKEKVLSFNEIPTAKGFRIFGASWRLISMGGAAFLHKYCDSLHKELGPIYKEKLGPTECIFLADPNMIRQVYQNEGKYPKHLVPEAWLIFNEIKGIKRGLFFMDGPEWEKRRHALNKIFLNKSLVSDYSEAFNQVISDLINGWDQLIPGTRETSLIDNCVSNNGDYLALSDGQQLGRFLNSNPTDKLDGNFGFVDQLEREMYKWSIESLATMVFGRRLGCLTASPTCSKSTGDQKEECVHEFVRCVKDLFVESTKMTVVPAKVVSKLNLPIWKRFMAAAGRALELARGYVEEELVIKRGISSIKSKKSGVLTTLLNKYNIEQDELARIVTDLFLAAADTTSHATQWAFYLLSKHPEVQDKIYQEIKSAVGEDGYIKEEHLKLLPHVRGVIKESLRLYPIAPFLSRILPHDIVLGGYRIPAGTLLCTSLYTTGRDDRFFWDASGFHPERWIRNRSATSPREVINSHASIPFGIGVRGCVGRKVAELQMQLLIARAIQKFHIEPGKEEDIEIKLRMITTPDEKINLKLRRRKADD